MAPFYPRLASGTTTEGDGWNSSQLLAPSELAASLKGLEPPLTICVGFPVLYRQKHIEHALFAGPASKPEGIGRLKEQVAEREKTAPIVIYCGCCPMTRCPNLRPAFSELSELGFTNVRVLNLPTNFYTDWSQKGYPLDKATASSIPVTR
jgi:hypothetical protein